MPDEVLITLTSSPDIEEAMLDWLLRFDPNIGYTTFPVHGHSSRQDGLTLAEKVAGRKRQLRYQMHLPQAELPRFLAELRRDFSGAGVHYWVSPVVDAGHV
jgi:hypothetical protein